DFPGSQLGSKCLDGGLQGFVELADAYSTSGPLPARRDGTCDSRALGVNLNTYRILFRFGNVAIRIEFQVAQVTTDRPKLFPVSLSARQPKPQGQRHGQKGGWIVSKKTPGDLVSKLVVLRTSDTMDEQVSQQETAEHCGGQSPGPQPDSPSGQIAKPL